MRTKAMEKDAATISVFDKRLGNEYMYYDVTKDKLYYIINVEVTFNGETSAVFDHWSEIK